MAIDRKIRLTRMALVGALVLALLSLSPSTASAQPACTDPYTCSGITGSISLQKFVSTSPGCPERSASLSAAAGSVVSTTTNDGFGATVTTHRVTLHFCYLMTNNTTGTLQAHSVFDLLAIPIATLPAPGTSDPAFFVAAGGSLEHTQSTQLTLRVDTQGIPGSGGACGAASPVISDGNVARWESKLAATSSTPDFVSNTAGTTVNVAAACASL